MRECCPNCGARLRRTCQKPKGSFTSAYRKCNECGYGDKILEKPAEIVRVMPMLRGRNVASTHELDVRVKPMQENHDHA